MKLVPTTAKTRKANGVEILMDLSENIGSDVQHKWTLLCLDHSYLIQDSNSKRLWGHSTQSPEWCDGCRGTDPQFPATYSVEADVKQNGKYDSILNRYRLPVTHPDYLDGN